MPKGKRIGAVRRFTQFNLSFVVPQCDLICLGRDRSLGGIVCCKPLFDSRRVPVTGGIFRPYVATAFVLSFLQLALYFVPTLRYLWITSLVSPVVGGMLAGVVFSYSDRVVKSEKKG